MQHRARGFAVSLAHPDGNVTGFTNFEATVGQKWLELLKEIAPHIHRVRVIFNPETAVNGGRYYFEPIEMAARKQQIEAVALPVRSAGDIEHAMAATAELSDVGLILLNQKKLAEGNPVESDKWRDSGRSIGGWDESGNGGLQ